MDSKKVKIPKILKMVKFPIDYFNGLQQARDFLKNLPREDFVSLTYQPQYYFIEIDGKRVRDVVTDIVIVYMGDDE